MTQHDPTRDTSMADPHGQVCVTYYPTLPAADTELDRAINDANEFLAAEYGSLAADLVADESQHQQVDGETA